MTEQELAKKLLSIGGADQILWSHFGNACLDSYATISAVNDFASFERLLNSKQRRKVRKDRLEKLYNLYLAVCKTRLALSKKLLEQFKDTIPGYENVSLFFFLDDICQLVSAGILIVNTPILDALKAVELSRRAHQELRMLAGDDSESVNSQEDPAESSILDYRISATPPAVWPNV